MPTATETHLLQFHDWTLRVRPPSTGPGRGLIVLLHGWTGTEDVMWVFAHKLPRDRWVISPRGLIAADSGYGWTSNRMGIATSIDDFMPACASVSELIKNWYAEHALPQDPVDLVGFSQGAALTFTIALAHPEMVHTFAGLAGFLPAGAEGFIERKPLSGRRAFIAHGTRDETVPIQAAKQAVRGLEQAGASVNYCESEVGHKLGAGCLRALEAFFNDPAAAIPAPGIPPGLPG